MGEQLRLNLRQPPDYRRAAFVVSGCNDQAARQLDEWPRWASPVKALIGPSGSGKTHLGHIWAERAGAAVVTLAEDPPADDLSPGGPSTDRPLLIDDCDRQPLGDRLFHILNRADSARRAVLLTGRTPPSQWATDLPDLRSRLNALPVLELGQPDDGVLETVLRRQFEERVITPAPELIAYLKTRIERSAPAAAAIVERLEAESALRRRPISRALARELLADADTDGD